jgi:HSP20 family protein
MARSLMRWDPLREVVSLRDAMDRLVGESLIRPWHGPGMYFGSEALALDMHETDTEVVVEATVPGVKPEEVDVQVTGSVLTIKGQRKEQEERRGASYICREQRFGSFCRSVSLPTEVDVDNAKAEFENGVLTLTLPKSETVKPKTIKITSK